MSLAWQESLFPPSGERLSFNGRTRHNLDARSWVDLVPGWVPDHAELFAEPERQAPWRQRTRRTWNAEVLEPRLVAMYDLSLPASLEQLRAALSQRYGVVFDSCLVNLYRDGSDAVAWHGDTVRHVLRHPVVGTVSLGSRRRILVRPDRWRPDPAHMAPGEGDLMVMGGAMQHDYQHTVPRDARALGARMSVTMRHSH